MFFERNAEALLAGHTAHQGLLKQVVKTALPDAADCQLLETLEGQYSLRYRGLVLHDASAPEAEALTVLQKTAHTLSGQVHLLVGLGLGYLPMVAFDHSPARIVVWEPDLALLRFVLENVDLSQPFASGRVWLTTHLPEALRQCRSLMTDAAQLDVVCLPAEEKRLAGYFPEFQAELAQMRGDLELDYRTAQHFHLTWLQRFFGNVAGLQSSMPIQLLAGSAKNRPAIVISRGPSLDAALPALKHIRDTQPEVVLIAVGGAIRPLWEGAGIIPDFALFYDANGMTQQLRDIPDEVLSAITFVCHPCTETAVWTQHPRAYFHFWTPYHRLLSQWWEKASGQAQPVLDGGGGSVSHIAMRQAMMMGCNPIVLAGQDLALPNNQAYAGGIALVTDGQGNMTLPGSETLYTEPEAMTTVLGQQGETLPAVHAFPGMIRQLEQLARENARLDQPATLYNTSLGGAHIQGFTLKSMAEIGELLAVECTDEGEQWNIQEAELPDMKKIDAALMQFVASLTEVVALSDTLLALVKKQIAKGQQSDAAALQSVLTEFSALLDRPENALLAFVPAFEMLAYKKAYETVLRQKTPGGLSTMFKEAQTLLERSRGLFTALQQSLGQAVAAEPSVSVSPN